MTGLKSNFFNRIKSISDWTSTDIGDEIEFICKEEYHGVIPEPVPAGQVLPEWYEKLEPFINGSERKRLKSGTAKRCIPLMEAMTAGWIIRNPSDIEVKAENHEVQANSRFESEILGTFDRLQVNNGYEYDPLNFYTQWGVNVPEGYSLFCTSPFNRKNPLFSAFTGIIDADRYNGHINAPAQWTGGDHMGVIEKGTPLLQVIPIKRDTLLHDSVVRSKTEEEEMEYEKFLHSKRSNEKYYRDEVWNPKKATRTNQEDN